MKAGGKALKELFIHNIYIYIYVRSIYIYIYTISGTWKTKVYWYHFFKGNLDCWF